MNESEKLAYKSAFREAISFTASQGLGNQKTPLFASDINAYEAARHVAQDRLGSVFVPDIKSQNLGGTKGEIWFVGSQCGNIHFNAQTSIKRIFPGVAVHLTIGGVVDASGASAFPYTQTDFLHDKSNRPEIIRGHVWLTFGGEYIVDLTLGTWLANTRYQAFTRYGSIISGYAGDFSFNDFPAEPRVLNKPTLFYRPVAVGNDALFAVAPPPS